jgi:hypothetical protein
LPPPVHDRVWDRVESDVATPSISSGAKWAVALVAAAAVIAVAVLGAQALTPTEEENAGGQQAPYGHTGDPDEGAVEEDPRPAKHVERSVARPAIDPPVEAVAIEQAVVHEPEPASKPRVRRAPRDASRTMPDAAPEASPEPAPVDTLGEETRMLKRARVALAASRPNDALSILDAYQRKFPAGRLAPERAALHVIALCDAGRSGEGSKAADAFLAAHPGHALASRVRRACDQ